MSRTGIHLRAYSWRGTPVERYTLSIPPRIGIERTKIHLSFCVFEPRMGLFGVNSSDFVPPSMAGTGHRAARV